MLTTLSSCQWPVIFSKFVALVDEEIKDEEMNAWRFSAVILELIEIRETGCVESNDFAIYNRIFWKFCQGFND